MPTNFFFLRIAASVESDQKTLFWISKRLLTKSLPSPPRQESQIFSKLHELCEDNGNSPGTPAKCNECNLCHPWRLAILFYFWRRASSGGIISLSSMGGDIAYERHTRFFSHTTWTLQQPPHSWWRSYQELLAKNRHPARKFATDVGKGCSQVASLPGCTFSIGLPLVKSWLKSSRSQLYTATVFSYKNCEWMQNENAIRIL